GRIGPDSAATAAVSPGGSSLGGASSAALLALLGDFGDPVDEVVWSGGGDLSFRRTGADFQEWYRARVAAGVVVGRFAYGESASERPPLAEFSNHVAGW